MAKNWWFKFDWDDWLGDEELSACSLETQGLWLRCICLMYRSDTAELSGTIEQLRRKLGVLPEEVTRCLHELKSTNAADVRFGNDDVSIVSRRRQREVKAKENNRLYVAKHREKTECKDDVRIQSKSKSKNKEKEEDMSTHTPAFPDPNFEYPIKNLVDAFPDYLPDRITPAMIGFIEAAVKPVDAEAWRRTIEIYQMNFNPLTKSYLPDKTANVLGVFRKQKTEVEREQNGSNKSNNFGSKPTPGEIIANRSYR